MNKKIKNNRKKGVEINTNLLLCSGRVRWARSPILVPFKWPVRESTSPVASFRPRRSIKDLSTCKTRLEFYIIDKGN